MTDPPKSVSSKSPGLMWLSEQGLLVLELSVQGSRSSNERLFFEYSAGDEMYDRILRIVGLPEEGENRSLSAEAIAAIFAE